MIPSRLRLFGYTASEALGVYGILTGMAMSVIMFPSVITNSVSGASYARHLRSQSRRKRCAHTARGLKTIRVCLLWGFLYSGFFATGHFIGNVLFGNALAGTFIRTLGWICPFLYLGVTLSSIPARARLPGHHFRAESDCLRHPHPLCVVCPSRLRHPRLSVRTSHQPGRHGSPLHRNSAAPDTSHFPLCIRKIICTKNTGKPDYGLPVFYSH